jgi:hypothetical protein
MSEEYDDELYYYEEVYEDKPAEESKLPAIVEDWVKSATEVSKKNPVPATMLFYNILGDIVKDMVALPVGRSIEDCRIHVLWLQTSGSGKSEMYNFVGPVVRRLYEIMEETQGKRYDIFDLDDYTDGTLIGSFKPVEIEETDDEGNIRREKRMEQVNGALHGQGLAYWDEFEYSGVFSQSQHKQNVIVYLNTFMNSLHGQNWQIKKKLTHSENTLVCECRRSSYATSYIPHNLSTLIAEKGVLQRMLIFVREVDEKEIREMREMVIRSMGVISDRATPVEKYALAFNSIYTEVLERFSEVNEDPLQTLEYPNEVREVIMQQYYQMEEFIHNARPEVKHAAKSFISRLLVMMFRLSALNCIAEAPSINDEKAKWVVKPRNALQAARIVRQSYMSLVSWLDEALKQEHKSVVEKTQVAKFKTIYHGMNKDDEGFAHKKLLLDTLRKETGKGQATIYRWWNEEASKYFEEKRIGKSYYVRLEVTE